MNKKPQTVSNTQCLDLKATYKSDTPQQLPGWLVETLHYDDVTYLYPDMSITY